MNGMYGYGNGYGYAPPYTPQMGTGAQMPQRCQVIKVNGRNGADAFRMAADSSVLLLDENDPIVWLKTTFTLAWQRRFCLIRTRKVPMQRWQRIISGLWTWDKQCL